ncbi:MAG: ATP-binding protein [Thermodesulfobacteriota bacterium]
MSIKTRLTIIFLTLAIVPAFFLSALVFHNSMEYIGSIVLSDLKLVAEGKEAEIREFIEAKRGRVLDFTTDAYIRSATESIDATKGEKERKKAGLLLSEYLVKNKLTVDPDLIEIHVLDSAGRVIASTDYEFIGHDDSAEAYFREGMKHNFVQGIDTHTHGGVEHRYIPITSPVTSNGKAVGVLMNGYSIDIARKLLSGERSRELGAETGIRLEAIENMDIFLVNRQGYLITPSKKVSGYNRPSGTKVETLPVRECLDGARDTNEEWSDILGRKVWGASSCIRIRNGPVWTLVVEQGREQALTPIEGLRYIFFVVGVGLVIVVALTALGIAQSISKPIERLRKGTEIVATGNLDYKVGSEAGDEIGALSRAFDRMTENLKTTTASLDVLEAEVAERRKVEEALRASEVKYRNFVDNSLVGIYSTTLRGEILYANRALAAMFGFESREEMMAEGIKGLYRDPARRDDLLKRLKEETNVEDFEAEFVAKNGEVKNILLSATLSGEVITGMIVDITEIRRAREIRREAEHIKAQAEMSSALANAAMDFHGVLATVTRYTAELLGDWSVIRLVSEDGKWLNPVGLYHRNPALMPLLRDFVNTNPMRADSGPEGTVVTTGEHLHIRTLDELAALLKPESRHTLERMGTSSLLTVPLRAYGRAIGTIAVARSSPDEPFTEEDRLLTQDLADRASLAISNARLFNEVQQELLLRKTAEEVTRKYADALERSNADLQQFAYVASHDLQEPLRMITSFLMLLSRRAGGRLDGESEGFIKKAIEGSMRMERMIKDLLDYSRVQTQPREHEKVDCEAVFKQAKENLRVAIKEENVLLTHDRLPVVIGDSAQLLHVFQNLIANAIKFRSEEQPLVHVSAREEGDEWVFYVRDNGIGISGKFKEKIFVIFQRVDEKKYPGTGIGLAVCKKIVERHGGRIWVESEEGKGSTFYFSIPREGAEKGRPPAGRGRG